MNIVLPPDTERLIEEHVRRGEYESSSALVNEAVQRLLAGTKHTAPSRGSRENAPALKLEPLPSLKGTLPPNWKDDIY